MILEPREAKDEEESQRGDKQAQDDRHGHPKVSNAAAAWTDPDPSFHKRPTKGTHLHVELWHRP
jgi:hypothetical protein